MNAKPSHPRPDHAPPAVEAAGQIDWTRVRDDFPILAREVHGKPLLYFDSANTGQKPAAVIDAVDRYYREYNANVSRAVHALGEQATTAYEATRDKLARFLNVRRDELVFRVARARGIPVMVTYAGGYAQNVEDTVTIHCNTVVAAREVFA